MEVIQNKTQTVNVAVMAVPAGPDSTGPIVATTQGPMEVVRRVFSDPASGATLFVKDEAPAGQKPSLAGAGDPPPETEEDADADEPGDTAITPE